MKLQAIFFLFLLSSCSFLNKGFKANKTSIDSTSAANVVLSKKTVLDSTILKIHNDSLKAVSLQEGKRKITIREYAKPEPAINKAAPFLIGQQAVEFWVKEHLVRETTIEDSGRILSSYADYSNHFDSSKFSREEEEQKDSTGFTDLMKMAKDLNKSKDRSGMPVITTVIIVLVAALFLAALLFLAYAKKKKQKVKEVIKEL